MLAPNISLHAPPSVVPSRSGWVLERSRRPGASLLLGCGWVARGAHGLGAPALGQAGEGQEPRPCQSSAQSCVEGGGRQRLICTLSASDRNASQVRTHHRPPWEGRLGQWVGRETAWERGRREGYGGTQGQPKWQRQGGGQGCWQGGGWGRQGEQGVLGSRRPSSQRARYSRLRWGAKLNSEEGDSPISCPLPAMSTPWPGVQVPPCMVEGTTGGLPSGWVSSPDPLPTSGLSPSSGWPCQHALQASVS